MVNKLKSISTVQVLAVILILIGLVIMIRYGIGTFNAYREVEYAYRNNFDAGNLDTDLMRPWMSMRYVAVAYTVPIEYLFSELGIELERRNGNASLDDLNDEYFRGQRAEQGYPIILDKLSAAILAYRENPVPTGLRQNGVRPWMNVQYIANSTGIPTEYLFEQIGIAIDDNAFIPLDRLSDEVRYPRGPRGLVEALQHAVDAYKAAP